MKPDVTLVSPETLALLEGLNKAAGTARSYRELEQIVQEQSQAFARLQFEAHSVQLEQRLNEDQKKVVPTVPNP
jgi:aspartate carbamoyltransferase catalytic subunit